MYMHTHFCTLQVSLHSQEKRNILKSFFIHMQTDVAQLLPRCKYSRNSPSCTANEHKLPPLHEEKRCTKGSTKGRGKDNPYLLVSRADKDIVKKEV